MGYEGDFTQKEVDYLRQAALLKHATQIEFKVDKNGIHLPKALEKMNESDQNKLDVLSEAGLLWENAGGLLRTLPPDHLGPQLDALYGIAEARHEGRIAPIAKEMEK